MLTEAQIQHIEEHQALFDEHQMEENTSVRGYAERFAHIPDLYLTLCTDLGIEPIALEPVSLDDPKRRPLARPSTVFERPPGNIYRLPDGAFDSPDET